MSFLDSEVDPKDVTVEIIGPELNVIPCNLNLKHNGGTCTFVPLIIGMYKASVSHPPLYVPGSCELLSLSLLFLFPQVTVYNGDEVVQGCPLFIRAMPEVSEIKHTGMEPCAVGSIVEVLVIPMRCPTDVTTPIEP